MYFCKQIEENDCGFACLKMLLANAYKDEEYLLFPQELGKGNYSFAELKSIAEKENLIIEGYEIENIFENKKVPLICQIKQNNITHFIYIYKVNKKEVCFYDPSFGKRTLKVEEFNEISTKKYLLIEKIGEHQKKTKSKILPFSYYLLLSIIIFFEFFFIFMMSFYTDKFHYEFVVFGLLFLICLYLQSLVQIKYMKKYDDNNLYPVLDKCPNSEKKEIKRGIENEYKLKGEMFKNNSSITLNASVIAFVGFILLVNDLKQIIGIVLIILTVFLKKLMLEKYNEPLKYQIFSLDHGDETVKKRLEKADYLSYKFGINIKMFDLLTLIIISTYCISISFINNSFYSCFYNIVIYKILFDKCENLVEYRNEKIRINKCLSYHYSFEKGLKM